MTCHCFLDQLGETLQVAPTLPFSLDWLHLKAILSALFKTAHSKVYSKELTEFVVLTYTIVW